MPPLFYRRDDWVQDALGNAVSGAGVYVTAQPTVPGHLDDDFGTYVAPTPQVQVFADPIGSVPLTQPVIADGYGHAFFYVSPGIYTITTYSPRISQVTLPDQVISALVSQVMAVAPTPTPNGSTTVFYLPSQPANYATVYLNGVLQLPGGVNYSLQGNIISFNSPPAEQDQLFAVYQ